MKLICEICGEQINNGENYISNENWKNEKMICEHCVKSNITTSELLEFLNITICTACEYVSANYNDLALEKYM